MAWLWATLLSALPAGDPHWINPPRLHNPTATTVTLAGVPAIDLEARVTVAARDPSDAVVVRASDLWSVEVAELTAGHPVTALVEVRAWGASEWTASASLALRTLPPSHLPTRIAIASDTHAWALWSVAEANPLQWVNRDLMQQAMANIAADGELDLVVHNGDWSMLTCGGCAPAGGSTAGTASSLEEALIRCRTAWGDEALGIASAAVPSIAVHGDHEAGMSWIDPELPSWSRQAHAVTLPSLPAAYARGPKSTRSYAVASGPVLIVALDVHSGMTRKPLGPWDWMLTPEHAGWVERVLASSDSPWKVIVAEHILGGLSPDYVGHWKARSSIRATEDGTPFSPFLGGQAALQQVALRHGVDLFVLGHDHVAAWGVKDGIAYLTGGRAGGVAQPWADEAWFRSALDYDGDGVPEYESGTTGSRAPGHVVIEADTTSLTARYILASLDADNGSEVFAQTLMK